MVDFYENQRISFSKEKSMKSSIKVADFIDTDPKRISWTRALKNDLDNNVSHKFNKNAITQGILRPFYKLHLYYDKSLIESPGIQQQFFSTDSQQKNRVICVSGIGANKQNCIYMTDTFIDYNAIDAGAKCFPLYYYEEQDKQSPTLFDYAEQNKSEYIRRDGVSDFILDRAKKIYGKNVTKEDIFYYVYGILHSPEYRAAFANDLKKQLPRLPLVENVKDFWAFSKGGRKLAELHVRYEEVPPAAGVLVHYNRVPQSEIEKGLSGKGMKSVNYRVEKMRFPAKGQKDAIIYNSQITVTNIPAKAYEYVVNGKSAIEWVMERYQVTTHKESGIVNDPNDWAEEVGDPKYILNLLLSVINVSVQTVEIVESLPRVKFE